MEGIVIVTKQYKIKHKTVSQRLLLFIYESQTKTKLKFLKEKEITQSFLSKSLNTTYAHCADCCIELEQLKLIECNKVGRLKIISLTNKGKLLGKAYLDLLECEK
jgi:predicted transcriptional regulator